MPWVCTQAENPGGSHCQRVKGLIGTLRRSSCVSRWQVERSAKGWPMLAGNDDRLDSLGGHHGAHAGARRLMGALGHDAREADSPLTSGPDDGRCNTCAVPSLEPVDSLVDRKSPELRRRPGELCLVR